MADFNSYDQDIMAEDVQDEVYIISPVDNPGASMSRSIRATATRHQWSEDALEKPVQNKAIEGDAASFASRPKVVQRENYCQIMTKTAEITGTLEEVDKYGRDSEMAYQLELKYGELANDEEAAIFGAFGATAGAAVPQAGNAGDAATAREMKAFLTQLDTNLNITATNTDVGTLENSLLQAHAATYAEGGNPGYLFTPPSLARNISNMAYSAGRARDIRNERRLINVIDLYVSFYGELDVVLDRNMVAVGDDASIADVDAYFLIDFNYSATPVLRATRDWPIAKLGDSDRRQVLRESTYAMLNNRAHAAVTGVAADVPLPA